MFSFSPISFLNGIFIFTVNETSLDFINTKDKHDNKSILTTFVLCIGMLHLLIQIFMLCMIGANRAAKKPHAVVVFWHPQNQLYMKF